MSDVNYAAFANWDGFLSEMSGSFDSGVTNLNTDWMKH